jgi:hypothetical protein
MSSTRRRWRIGAFLAVAMLVKASPGLAVSLELAPIELENGAKIKFDKNDCEPIDALPFAKGDENVNHVQLPHYDLYFRIEDIVPKKSFGFIRYRFYVKPKAPDEGVKECVISGRPSGSFHPQLADVNLYVGEEAAGRDSATIHLPILGLTSPDYLTYPHWTEPEKIEIGHENEIDLQLQNLLADWPIRISAVSQPSRKEIWQQAELLVKGQKEFAPFDIPTGGVSKDRLVLKLSPNSGRALLNALFSRNLKGDPENVTVSLEYTAQLGLKDLEKETLVIPVPVRFVPWPPLLIFVLILGTLLGSLIPLTTGQRRKADWLHAFSASLPTAILAWLIAILLVQNNSEFRLLGFALDPFQLLPAALIGALLGLQGFRSLELLKRFIPGLGKEAASAKTGGGDKP